VSNTASPNNPQLVTAAQIKKSCPVEVEALGNRIATHLQKARAYEAKAHEKIGVELRKADDHWTTVTQLLAEAKAKCDGGGFKAFKEKFCPDLSRSRIYELLQIGSGTKTVEESRAANRKRVAKHRGKVSVTSSVMYKPPVESPPAAIGNVSATESAEVSIEQRRAEHAALDLSPELEAEPETVEDAEAEVKRLKTLKAKLKNNNADKIDASASAKALAVFKAACGDRLPEMNADDLQSAIDYFAEAVEVPATELMPDLKDVQMDVRIAKAEVAALKRKLVGKPAPRESRANAWQRLADEAAANIEQLIEYQGEFESAKSAQPDSLRDGPFAQKCEEICGIDLESALSALQEAADAEVPLGFGRD
jgi:hypothetical protein